MTPEDIRGFVRNTCDTWANLSAVNSNGFVYIQNAMDVLEQYGVSNWHVLTSMRHGYACITITWTNQDGSVESYSASRSDDTNQLKKGEQTNG